MDPRTAQPDPTSFLRASRHRSLVAIIALVLGLATLALAAPSDSAAAGDTRIEGTWDLTVRVTSSGLPAGYKAKSGHRVYYFGAGCTLSACNIERTSQDGLRLKQALTSSGGGWAWANTTKVDCVDLATGALTVSGGFDWITKFTFAPTSTAPRDGVTYVKAMAGSMSSIMTVNARGRAQNCLVEGKSSAADRGTITVRPVPLAAPKADTRPAVLAAASGRTEATSGTIDNYTFAQSSDQAASRRAVDRGTRSTVPAALTTPADAVGSGRHLAENLLLAALLGLLMVFPAQIFNSTYEENHGRVDAALRKLRPGRRTANVRAAETRTRRVAVFAAAVLAGSVIGGFLDPGFGANTPSISLVIGILLSVFVAVGLAAYAARTYRGATHHAGPWMLHAVPSALVIAVLCVVISRLVHFEPGYLYGVIGGATFTVALGRRDEGRAEVMVVLAGLALALGAWVGFGLVVGSANGTDPSIGVLVADSFLASLFIGGIEGLLFGLVPLRFLPGYRIKGWSWTVWIVLTGVVTFVFANVLLRPDAGYLGRSTGQSAMLTYGLFVAFAVASVLFWLWFRFRPGPSEEGKDEQSEPPLVVEPAPLAVGAVR